YRGPANPGTHTGKLYPGSGTILASANFSGESATGWQQVAFASPVAITANTTYVASYGAPNGNYSYDQFYFRTGGFSDPPVRALGDGEDGPQGMYSAFAAGFPDVGFNATN